VYFDVCMRYLLREIYTVMRLIYRLIEMLCIIMCIIDVLREGFVVYSEVCMMSR
jgi:hypothetical protein